MALMAGRPKKSRTEAKTALVSTLVDMPTKARLDEISRDEDLSLSRILREAINQFLERRAA